MNLETLAAEYITVPEIAFDLGITILQAHTLCRAHTFPPGRLAFGKPIFKRADYQQWKADNPERIAQLQEKNAAKVAA